VAIPADREFSFFLFLSFFVQRVFVSLYLVWCTVCIGAIVVLFLDDLGSFFARCVFAPYVFHLFFRVDKHS